MFHYYIFNIICAIICAVLAKTKGRTVIGWFLLGFFLTILAIIIGLCVSNKKDEKQKHEQLQNEQRRLHEQLRQERLKNEQFRKHAQTRLDAHDNVLELDTRQTANDMGNDNLIFLDDGHSQPTIPLEPMEEDSNNDFDEDDNFSHRDPYKTY